MVRSRCINRLRGARRKYRLRTIGRLQGGEVALEAGRVPAPSGAVEGVRTGSHGFIWLPPPVGQVVAALVAPPRPVTDLVRTPALAGKESRRVVVHGRSAFVGRAFAR